MEIHIISQSSSQRITEIVAKITAAFEIELLWLLGGVIVGGN